MQFIHHASLSPLITNLHFFPIFQALHNKVDKVPEVYDLYAMAHTASFKKVKAFSQSDLDDAKQLHQHLLPQQAREI